MHVLPTSIYNTHPFNTGNMQMMKFSVDLSLGILLLYYLLYISQSGGPLPILTAERPIVSGMFFLYSIMLLDCCQLT